MMIRMMTTQLHPPQTMMVRLMTTMAEEAALPAVAAEELQNSHVCTRMNLTKGQ